MATCRECIHQELCDNYSRMGVTDVPADDITICELFKSKSDYVKRERGEWVSVKDRLPEIPNGYKECPDRVLYMMKSTKTIDAGYYGEDGIWRDKYFRKYTDASEGVDANDILCWMYQKDLPEPPKGE